MGLSQPIVGIVALLWMVLAFIPLLGWGNWFLIPFAAVGALIAAIALLFTSAGNRGRAKTGLVLNGLVIVVGMLRLTLGGGII
ncbi:membrane protein [Xanthomonas oryzae pv. oryzae]|nr:membrane protein [Xanthomonas oryzae pv. oryzicola]OLH97911.1 membrane protein [Xanthomonas oryzae pv. oryzae]